MPTVTGAIDPMSPVWRSLVISVPHAGSEVPPAIRPSLAQTESQILATVDVGTAQIFGPLPAAAVIIARWSRFVVDLNRDHRQLDEKGVIAQTDYFGQPVFLPGQEPNQAEIESRIDRYFRPYHRRLARAVAGEKVKLLIDGHSLDDTGPADAPDAGRSRPDVVLGNGGDPGGGPGDGDSCSAELLDALTEALEKQGLSVARNFPYSGGFITRRWGPFLRKRGGGAIQIEINKRLFLDRAGRTVIPDRAAAVRRRLGRALADAIDQVG
jgi:N-formylglutamate amidohydrolase